MHTTTLRSAAIIALVAVALILGPLPTRSQQDKDVRVVAIEGEQRAGADKWAILIGINDYIDPGIADLKYAVQDVEAVHRVLENSGQFAGIKLMTDWATTIDLKPTRNNILSAIKTLALSIAQPNDTIVIYISAHGITESSKNFLLPQDAKLGLLADTAVSLDRIYDYLNESQSKAQVVILDACHSGARKDRAGETLQEEFVFSAEGRITLASSGISESSFEWDEKQHGVFSYYVVEGLAGAADSNGDGFVTAMETSTYVTSGVRKWAFDNSKAQNPRMMSNISGDIVLSRVKERPMPDTTVERPVRPETIQPETRPDLDRATTGDVFLSVRDEWGTSIDGYVVEISGSRVSTIPGQPVSDLNKGSHTLTVKARGYYDKTVDVYIDPGTVRSEDVVLRRLRGKLEVTSEPPGADVLIDGSVAGKTNDVFGDLIDGREYTVKVRKEGYSPSEEEKVAIVGERTTDLAFALLSLPTLEVIANVEGFTLLVDGTDKGKASGQAKKITVDEPKTVSIKIQKEGYQDWSKSGIGLKAGATERVTAEMIRRNLLHITAKVTGGSPSDADGVEIVVDGKSRGRLSGGEMKVWDLPAGAHDVTIKTGKQNIEKNAYVSDGKTAMIELEFARDDLRPGGMVYIPAGSFMMGCSPGDSECDDDEKPAKKVTLTKGFYMDATEVTQGEYERVMRKNPSSFKDCGADCPVESVSWYDAKAYCEKVGKRLPTEAEWEYAARGGSNTKYYWGNSFNRAYVGSWKGSPSTFTVGHMKANAFGLFDMAGNVREWVQDCYSESWYNNMPTTNPLNVSKKCENRVLRDGDHEVGDAVRVSDRTESNPNYGLYVYGFRCAKDSQDKMNHSSNRPPAQSPAPGTITGKIFIAEPDKYSGNLYIFILDTETLTSSPKALSSQVVSAAAIKDSVVDFNLDGVPPGDHMIVVQWDTAAPYCKPSSDYCPVSNHDHFVQSDIVRVPAGGSVSGIRISLR